jgi:hypothetical protein
MNLSAVCLLIGLVCFGLAAFGVSVLGLELIGAGLFFIYLPSAVSHFRTESE